MSWLLIASLKWLKTIDPKFVPHTQFVSKEARTLTYRFELKNLIVLNWFFANFQTLKFVSVYAEVYSSRTYLSVLLNHQWVSYNRKEEESLQVLPSYTIVAFDIDGFSRHHVQANTYVHVVPCSSVSITFVYLIWFISQHMTLYYPLLFMQNIIQHHITLHNPFHYTE